MELTDKEYKELLAKNESLEAVVKDLDGRLQAFESFGSPAEISEVYDKFESTLAQYTILGTPEEITAKFESADTKLAAYADLGEPEMIGEVLEISKAFIVTHESEAIALQYGLGVDTVAGLIEKMESIDSVKEMLATTMTNKSESADTDTETLARGKKPTTTPAASEFRKLARNL